MKKASLLLILPMLLALAACASLKLPGSQPSTSNSNTNQPQNQMQNFANQPVEQKLAIGILKLEGTDKAVTAEQAKTLLPLWKGVKSLSGSTTSSMDEINGLYKQIQENLTAEQVQAIKDMDMKPEDFQALMKEYNIQVPQGGPRPQGTPGANGNSTRGNSSGGGDIPGGGMPGGGMPPDGGGGFPGGGNNSGNTGGNSGRSNAQRTLQPGQERGGMRSFGMNGMFVNPVITLLQKKAGG